jgi:TPR repeat protein
VSGGQCCSWGRDQRANCTLTVAGDLWTALDLFEEAADLGVAAAQENAAYLLEQLAVTECRDLQGQLEGTNTTSVAPYGGEGATGACHSAEECCELYMQRLATHHWAQLSEAGEPRAMRKMATALLDPARHVVVAGNKQDISSSPELQAVTLFALASEQGDTESLLHLGWMFYDGTHGTCNHAVEYRFLLSIPDSVRQLTIGVPQNRSAAELLFKAALEIEAETEGTLDGLVDPEAEHDAGAAAAAPEEGARALTPEERLAEHEAALRRHQHARRWHTAGYASRTTGGAAPALALAVVEADRWLHLLGLNTSVAELHQGLRAPAGRWLPSTVLQWAGLGSVRAAGRGRGSTSSSTRLEKGWLGTVASWARGLQRWEERNPYLYAVAWEVAVVLLIVAACGLAVRVLRP